MAVFYLDYEAGSDAADGLSFANRWKTITSGATAARIAPGDTIRIMASPDQTSLGQAALWTNLSKSVVLTTAVTANIDDGEAAWTASANVTATADTVLFKENTKSAKLVIAAGFVTGLAAYKALGAATDFSGYNQVSFWIRNTVAIPTGASLSLRLCSDAAGVTTVDTIAIPAIPSINQWTVITVDKAAALGASIQSVALYVDSDFGAVEIQLDNIIACKDATLADSLSLTSLIGKNTAGETFYGIQSINGTTVKLDNITNTLGNAGRGYAGTTESVTTWKRETIKTAMVVGGASALITDTGTVGAPITFSGGWNRTDMTTQVSVTWFDGQNGAGDGIAATAKNFIILGKINVARYSIGINLNATTHYTIESIEAICCATGVNPSTASNSNTRIESAIANNNSTGVSINLSRLSAASITANSNTSTGLNQIAGMQGTVSSATVKNNVIGVGAALGEITIFNLTTADNTTAIANTNGRLLLFNASIAEATEFSAPTTGANSRTISINHDQTADNHLINTDGGLISSEATIRHTASGIAWKLQPTSTNRSETYPLDYVLGPFAVDANALVTVKLWMRRSNAGLTMKLRCRGGQINGVAADVEASMSAAADTWEEITLTFTPTAKGAVEIDALAYGGTTYTGYIDDLTITQA